MDKSVLVFGADTGDRPRIEGMSREGGFSGGRVHTWFLLRIFGTGGDVATSEHEGAFGMGSVREGVVKTGRTVHLYT